MLSFISSFWKLVYVFFCYRLFLTPLPWFIGIQNTLAFLIVNKLQVYYLLGAENSIIWLRLTANMLQRIHSNYFLIYVAVYISFPNHNLLSSSPSPCFSISWYFIMSFFRGMEQLSNADHCYFFMFDYTSYSLCSILRKEALLQIPVLLAHFIGGHHLYLHILLTENWSKNTAFVHWDPETCSLGSRNMSAACLLSLLLTDYKPQLMFIVFLIHRVLDLFVWKSNFIWV